MLCREHQLISYKTPLVAQRTLSRHSRYRRMVVLFRQVRQNEEFRTSIIIFCQKIRESVIGKVSHAAHDPLLHRPGIRAYAQHLYIVVGLDHQYLAAADVMLYAGRHITKIGAHTNFDAFTAKRKAHGIDRIMRYRERHDRHVPNLKRAARLKSCQPLQVDPITCAIARVAAIRVMRSCGHVHGNLQLLGEHVQTAYVVGMFVGDQDGVDQPGILAASRQAPQQLAARQSCIHQQAAPAAGNQRAIASAAARQDRYRDCHEVENNWNFTEKVVTIW